MQLSKIIEYLLYFGISAIISFLFMPQVYQIAKNVRAIDDPSVSDRKIHTKKIPRLGGLIIYLSFLVVFTIVGIIGNPQLTGLQQLFKSVNLFQNPPMFVRVDAILIGSFVVVLMGIFDDISPIKAWKKFVYQFFAAAVVVYYGNFYVTSILGIELPTVFARLFTVIWIVMITNAINFTDGLDGLAGGLSFISLMTMAVIGMLDTSMFAPMVVVLTLILAGAIFGFLPYNLPPARIFMGDSGALFIGFMIGTLSVLGYKQAAFSSFLIPVVILAVPIFDTVFAFFRRTLKRIPAGTPDANHVHHKVLQTTQSQKVSLFWIYGLSLLFSTSAIIYSFSKSWGTIVFIITFIIAEVFVEYFSIVSLRYRPLLRLFSKAFPNGEREAKRLKRVKEVIRNQEAMNPGQKKSKNGKNGNGKK